MSDHFRLRARYPLRVRVAVRRHNERSSREIEAVTENLGFGGLFVLADPPLPVGTKVQVAIVSATTWDPLKFEGTVRWVRDVRPGVAAGMGIAFDSMRPEHAVAIYRLVEAQGFADET